MEEREREVQLMLTCKLFLTSFHICKISYTRTHGVREREREREGVSEKVRLRKRVVVTRVVKMPARDKESWL